MATDLTALTASLGISVTANAARALDLSTPADALSLAIANAFSFGSGANMANQIWHDRRILAGAASEELDLAGSLTNAFGQSVTFAKIKALLIRNRSGEVIGAHAVATDAALTAGGAVANAWVGPFGAANDTLGVPAGGSMLLVNPTAAGWAVTAGTGDLLKILNADATDELCYEIFILGESA